MKISIVGSGIIGLSLCEYFSRKNFDITCISDEEKISGSKAAGALLSTKAQLFGRGEHYQLKLDAKKIYKKWLTEILEELGSTICLNEIYREGEGVEVFESDDEASLQIKRIVQPQAELKSRGLPMNPVERLGSKVVYKNEAWVDAPRLLVLLKRVCEKRGVQFEEKDVLEGDFLKTVQADKVILATGYWTPSILAAWGYSALPKARATWGSTFWANGASPASRCHAVILETHRGKTSVSLSGTENNIICSSTTVKNRRDLDETNELFLDVCHEIYGLSCESFQSQTGPRIGFGHREIVVKHLEGPVPVIVCAGAHKSGYLFGPVIGPEVEKLLPF